jgi:hypothetical protein
MRAVSVTDIGSDTSLSLVSALKHDHENSRTKRVVALVERVARLKSELEEAETALEFERTRMPVPGDFVRCPLTSFFGRVTKVKPRPSGRPWVEIVPYLGPNLPGHSAMDLFESWELIDPPAADSEAGEAAEATPKLPTIAPFMPMPRAMLAAPDETDDVEASLRKLWASPKGISS